MEFILGFFAGLLTATIIIVGYGMYKLRQLSKARDKIIGELQKSAQDAEKSLKNVTERLNKAREITEKQLGLLGQIDQPSKNALHSKWKNDLNHEVRKLEDEKNEILRSILKDGYDPTITILNANDQKETIKLSDYLARIGLTKEDPAPPSDDPNGPKKVGKFMVYSGGNSKADH